MSRQALGKNPKAVATGILETITAEGRALPDWGGDGFQGVVLLGAQSRCCTAIQAAPSSTPHVLESGCRQSLQKYL